MKVGEKRLKSMKVDASGQPGQLGETEAGRSKFKGAPVAVYQEWVRS